MRRWNTSIGSISFAKITPLIVTSKRLKSSRTARFHSLTWSEYCNGRGNCYENERSELEQRGRALTHLFVIRDSSTISHKYDMIEEARLLGLAGGEFSINLNIYFFPSSCFIVNLHAVDFDFWVYLTRLLFTRSHRNPRSYRSIRYDKIRDGQTMTVLHWTVYTIWLLFSYNS